MDILRFANAATIRGSNWLGRAGWLAAPTLSPPKN